MSGDGQPYWLSNSLGAQLPYDSIRNGVLTIVRSLGIGTYARVDSNFTSCNVDTAQPDGAGVCCESRQQDGAESHVSDLNVVNDFFGIM